MPADELGGREGVRLQGQRSHEKRRQRGNLRTGGLCQGTGLYASKSAVWDAIPSKPSTLSFYVNVSMVSCQYYLLLI